MRACMRVRACVCVLARAPEPVRARARARVLACACACEYACEFACACMCLSSPTRSERSPFRLFSTGDYTKGYALLLSDLRNAGVGVLRTIDSLAVGSQDSLRVLQGARSAALLSALPAASTSAVVKARFAATSAPKPTPTPLLPLRTDRLHPLVAALQERWYSARSTLHSCR